MKHVAQLYINFTGGLVSPGELHTILSILKDNFITEVCFGLRQQMIIEVPGNKLEAIEHAFTSNGVAYEKGRTVSPNIVSSYVAANIFTTESWLREGVYKDIFDQVTCKPRLKMNICDTAQNLVPFFTGHINWLSSSNQHFWHLYIRLPKSSPTYYWPNLIYTNSIGAVSHAVEQFITSQNELQPGGQAYYAAMEKYVQEQTGYISHPALAPAFSPRFYFPYYEGLNKETTDTCWLGIYRRDEMFSVNFLQDACAICLQTKIGQLYITPWKSVIIKGINNADRYLWNAVLGKYRINVRHAANELNWQVEDGSYEGLVLKRSIIRHFDKEDVRTYGLSFAVETKSSANMFGSVIIRKRERTGTGKLKSQERFDILYSKDFDPNSKSLLLYRDKVAKHQVGPYLESLCKLYYEQAFRQNPPGMMQMAASVDESNEEMSEKLLYQCTKCQTMYDEEYGCVENHIPAGTKFASLAESYCCPVCEAPKSTFISTGESLPM
ncbi:MAG TPA: rubredoxin [Chitinophagaceae bacterium]|nr:rubredoxin [Chitinophagaceae bacterium]